MSFFEKFAKLKSEVRSASYGFEVNVYDDELDGNNKIMWLQAEIKKFDEDDLYDYDSGELLSDVEEDDPRIKLFDDGYEEYIYVPIVNTNDSIYFNLPENRRQTAATALFKAFIKFYLANYKGVPVGADFANHELSQKFQKAIDQGIFPKISEEIYTTVDSDEWDKSVRYNIHNREYLHDEYNKLIQALKDKGYEVQTDDSIFLTSSMSSFLNDYDSMINDMKSRADGINLDSMLTVFIFFTFKDNGISFFLPIQYNPENNGVRYTGYFRYLFKQNVLEVGYATKTFKDNEQVIRNVFDNQPQIAIDAFDNKTMSMDEFFNSSKDENMTATRLKRNVKKA